MVSEQGFGKRSALADYRITHRGGKGVKTMQITEKTGDLVAITNVSEENDIMIINRSGVAIRMKVDELRVMGRATQGVKLINLRGKDNIASIASVPSAPEEEETTDNQEAALSDNTAETASETPDDSNNVSAESPEVQE